MNPQQVQQLFTTGALATFTGCDAVDGPCTWAAVRLSDGLAVCTEVLPVEAHDAAAIHTWLALQERTWMLLDEAEGGWCFAQWWFGRTDPEEHAEPTALLTGQGGEALLLLAAAACSLAQRLYAGWATFEPGGVEIAVVAVFPLRGAGES